MKESDFIKQNKEKWLDFENNIEKKDMDPSKTTRLFVQITDDLSYARTFYPNRSVRLYLNSSVRLLFNDIHRSHRNGLSDFFKFWTRDLPLTLYAARRAMLISLLVFLACFILGIITSNYDKEFAASILSSDYVHMTDANIAKGDPMAVYKSDSAVNSFLYILYNNLRVDLLTFFSGIFMAIGSLVIMVSNGVMVGVFQYYFVERDLFRESFLTIWTHGALEIPTIILSGGAGLTLGSGLLFPGAHTRLRAFRISGMNGLKIISGVIPVTILAAFIEGFITRHTEFPDLVRLGFILLCFALIFFYFVYYPRQVAKRYPSPGAGNNPIAYTAPAVFDPSEIYSPQKIITETFRQLFATLGQLGRPLLLLAGLAALLVGWNPLDLFRDPDVGRFALIEFFNYADFPLLGAVALLSLTGLMVVALASIKTKLGGDGTPLLPRNILAAFTASAVFALLVFINLFVSHAFAQVLLPVMVYFCCVAFFENLSFGKAIAYGFRLLGESWGRLFLCILVFFLLGLMIYVASAYLMRTLNIDTAVLWMLTDDAQVASNIASGIAAFQGFASFFLYVVLLLISGSLLYFTLKEMHTASHLLRRIREMKLDR